ncbi:PTS transporter subunit EIIC [Vibrio mangrovi]|uniref:PTS system beta-glucoside-specific EIIBCA component n=1 Tax=Vibrio mangrovi TaxID=474394 RepID=A0A1Y6IWG7_9VIBR|nr:PTS transporter subunit EIIC [Vibrio mangrovi]MDW6002473.1 PTS transporter subunit EIIC [Vibrio mangrovi]SMS01997.1 PTS system beta-glucoside-specific EIIBCA component [Vibrio mangrovi]
MNYSNLAKTILRLVGDKENVAELAHCATRLRFKLNDHARANKEEIQSLDGVLSVVESGGQFQVIIGNHVSQVFSELMSQMGGASSAPAATDSTNTAKNKASIGSRIFEVISGSFTPLLGPLAGAGMLKAVLAVVSLMNWMDASSSSYLILSAIANAVFYFLPVFLGISAAIKMGANGYLGGVIGAALLEPNFTGLIGNADATFFGIPVVAINYSSTVFPIFIAVAGLAFLEKQLKKICPQNLQMFLVPMICLLVIVPLTVLIFGPFGVNLGNVVAAGINWLSAHSGALTGAVIGGTIMFMVVLGLHWGLVPIVVANLALGGSPIAAMWAPCTFAQMGIAVAFFLRSKDPSVKAIAGPAAITGLLAGVTEPIIYGLILRYRRAIPVVMISGAAGGCVVGYFQTKMTAFGFHNIFTIPLFDPLVPYIIGISLGFGLSVILGMMFAVDNQKQGEGAGKQQTVAS